MTVTVDGNRREEPWTAVHFVECAPGTHKLELEWSSQTIGGHSLASLEQDITVEAGHVIGLSIQFQHRAPEFSSSRGSSGRPGTAARRRTATAP
jgi:hypothetical protein